MQTVHLEPSQVPATLRGSYRGKSLKVVIAEQVTIPAHAGTWDGGSRDTYRAVRIADGANVPLSDNMSAPWDSSRSDRVVKLEPGIAVIERTFFQGKDLGLRIYVCASDAAPMLPAPIELSTLERVILTYTVGRKSSYMGKDRYQMACEDMRYSSPETRDLSATPTRVEWEQAKSALISRGLLNKAGAITVAGRNACKVNY